MSQTVRERIETLRDRLARLRKAPTDAVARIAIDALEVELSRTAARLPREWDLFAADETSAGGLQLADAA